MIQYEVQVWTPSSSILRNKRSRKILHVGSPEGTVLQARTTTTRTGLGDDPDAVGARFGARFLMVSHQLVTIDHQQTQTFVERSHQYLPIFELEPGGRTRGATELISNWKTWNSSTVMNWSELPFVWRYRCWNMLEHVEIQWLRPALNLFSAMSSLVLRRTSQVESPAKSGGKVLVGLTVFLGSLVWKPSMPSTSRHPSLQTCRFVSAHGQDICIYRGKAGYIII
jgi:hypothetical protein